MDRQGTQAVKAQLRRERRLTCGGGMGLMKNASEMQFGESHVY